jgi:hypothetical protein
MQVLKGEDPRAPGNRGDKDTQTRSAREHVDSEALATGGRAAEGEVDDGTGARGCELDLPRDVTLEGRRRDYGMFAVVGSGIEHYPHEGSNRVLERPLVRTRARAGASITMAPDRRGSSSQMSADDQAGMLDTLLTPLMLPCRVARNLLPEAVSLDCKAGLLTESGVHPPDPLAGG